MIWLGCLVEEPQYQYLSSFFTGLVFLKRIMLHDSSPLHLGTLGNKKKWRERVRSRHLLCNLHLIPLLFAGWPTIIVGVLHLDNLCFALSRKQIYSFLPGWIGRSPLMEWVEKGYGSARHTFSYINIFSNSPPVLATSLSSLPEVTFSDPFLITPF